MHTVIRGYTHTLMHTYTHIPHNHTHALTCNIHHEYAHMWPHVPTHKPSNTDTILKLTHALLPTYSYMHICTYVHIYTCAHSHTCTLKMHEYTYVCTVTGVLYARLYWDAVSLKYFLTSSPMIPQFQKGGHFLVWFLFYFDTYVLLKWGKSKCLSLTVAFLKNADLAQAQLWFFLKGTANWLVSQSFGAICWSKAVWANQSWRAQNPHWVPVTKFPAERELCVAALQICTFLCVPPSYLILSSLMFTKHLCFIASAMSAHNGDQKPSLAAITSPGSRIQ